MLIQGTMNPNNFLACLFLSSAVVPMMLGCQTSVNGGGQGGSGGSQPSGAGGSVTIGSGGSVTTGSGGDPTPAPSGNARLADGGYMVTLSNHAAACGDTGVLPNCGPVVWWSIQLALPTSALVAGTTFGLKDIHPQFWEQLAGDAAKSDCGYGAGTYSGAGSVEIVAASATELTLHVTGTGAAPLPEGGMDGTYVVPICSGPTPQNDGTAIAMRFDQTPGNNTTNAAGNASCTGASGGPVTDPDTLVLFLSNLGQSCTDPDHNQQKCITPRYQVSIQVPVDQQTTGSFSLQGHAMLTHTTSENPGACGGSDFYPDGTIDILTILPSSVTFTLAGTADIGPGFGNADGTYTAPRCF